MEIVLTATLVSVILGTASAAQNVGAIAALGVGGYIALAGLWSAPVSGTSMNPARSFGPSPGRYSPSAAHISCAERVETRSPVALGLAPWVQANQAIRKHPHNGVTAGRSAGDAQAILSGICP